MDYKNSKIYKLQCEDGHYYIGSTATELRKRLKGHKDKSKESPNQRVYKHINELGWDKVRIVLIEEYPCENKQQLTRKEDEVIRQHRDNPLCLNSMCASRTEEQYNEYLEQHKEYKKQWYEKNKDTVNEYKKSWYMQNRERILQKRKEYYVSKKSNVSSDKEE